MTGDDLVRHNKKIRLLIDSTINKVMLAKHVELYAKKHCVKKNGPVVIPSERGL